MFDICVLGSLNMDLVINVERIPSIGETILAKDFKKFPGGKGANQAVASARLGSNVVMLGCIGKDDNGCILIDNLKRDNINTRYIKVEEKMPTGIALITVDSKGNNIISVYPGANMAVDLSYVEGLKEVFKNSKIIISQFETPIDVTLKAFEFAKKEGKTTILNPAPAKKIDKDLISLSDIIIPNETETELITGINPKDEKDIKRAGEFLIKQGAKYVVITLGERGAAIISKENFVLVNAYKVDAVDTTAAGDSFIGAMASYLSKKDLNFNTLYGAVKFANKVSAITVTKIGAQSSLPYLKEVFERFGEE